MGPRWKGKDLETKALANPMSKIVSHLQNCLKDCNASGALSGFSVLLAMEMENANLLVNAGFGCPIMTSDKTQQWFQLGMDEAFYLCTFLTCLKLVDHNGSLKTEMEAWQYMISLKPEFPGLYIGYSHLRNKNWVVRPGSQYGVDFVVYRHHPSMVHSEYAVIVLFEEDKENYRLRAWSDVYGAIRVCASVAKTLLLLDISKSGNDAAALPWSLESYIVSERTLSRWIPEQNREI